MVDSVSASGDRSSGFMTQLTHVLGAGSFDDAPESRWFAHMLRSGIRLGAEFASAWREMQAEVGEVMPGSILADPASSAGRRTHR
eukprot:12212738-Karenia_brevis.AAC.1